MSKVSYLKSPIDEWDYRTSKVRPKKIDTVPFAKELEAVLPHSKNLKCLEVGAIPGSFLVYLHKTFGYSITGIDFSKNTNKFDETMNINSIKKYEFINGDFFKYKFRHKFDVVCSFGFIEHFDDVKNVVDRHCELVADHGYLVLEVPNFRYLQYLYHFVFDRENLRIHNTKAMQPKYVGDIIVDNGFEEVFNGYVGGVEIWNDGEPTRDFMRRINNKIKPVVNRRKEKIKNSRFYSPMVLMIYKKA